MSTRNENGFTIIEVLLVTVIVALLGYIGYNAWHATQAKTTTSTNAVTHSTQALKTPTDPYKDWKQFCSDTSGKCLKYPPTWTLTARQTNEVENHDVTIKAPSSNLSVYYNPFLSGIGGTSEPGTIFFTPSVIDKHPKLAGQNIVAGTLTNHGNSPQYEAKLFVASDQDVHSYYAEVNKSYDVGLFIPRMSDKIEVFEVRPMQTFSSAAAVNTWLDTPDVKTARLILESLSVN